VKAAKLLGSSVGILVVCLSAAVGLAQSPAEVKPPLSPETLAKLRDPIPDRPNVKSPLTAERVKWVCQYGNLRMMSYLNEPAYEGKALTEDERKADPAWQEFLKKGEALKATLKKYNVTFVTHASGGSAVSFCNRFKTVKEMRENSLLRRPTLQLYHDCDVVAIPYADYQRCIAKSADGLYNHWEDFRKEWSFVFGPLPEKIDDLLETNFQGKLLGTDSHPFAPDVPFSLARAFFCMGVDLNNGADGLYWDNGAYSPDSGYAPPAVKCFQEWLGSRFTGEQRKDLFGTDDVSQLTPQKAVADKGIHRLNAKEVTPLTVAFLRYRNWKQGWLRERMVEFGRSINPNYVMMSTYWSHAGSPYGAVVDQAYGIEEITKDGKRDTMLFWEPETAGAGAGNTLAQAKETADKEGKKDFRYGRRSFSCSLQQMVGGAYVPVVSKQKAGMFDNKPSADLTELLYAEAYANLVSMRTGLDNPYSFEGIERMHAFQAAHPDFFVGAKPYARAALLCSDNQFYGLRAASDPVPFSRKLLDIGLAHQVIPDRMITPEGLANLDVLFLYKAELLSERQMTALEAFKKRGVLVVVGPSGTHDEWNRPRDGGMARLVGDLPGRAAEAAPAVSEDKHVVYVPDGTLTKTYQDFWYRHSDDGDMAPVKKALEQTAYGLAWPYLAPQASEQMEIHLHQIPKDGRILAHVVNYNVQPTMTPAAPMELAVRLYGDKKPTAAKLISPEPGAEIKSVDVKVEHHHGAPYAVISLPPVRVYAIVALD